MSSNNELVITFKGDTSDALSKTNGLKGALGDLGNLAGGAVNAGLMGVAAGFAAMAAGAAAAGVVVSQALQATAEWGGQLDTLGDVLGMSGEQASTFAVALNRVGLSVEEGGTALNFFARGLADIDKVSSTGTITPMAEAFKKLGVSAKTSAGQLKEFDEVMPELMDAFKELPAGVDATALAMDLFGARGGTKFLDFLRSGSTGLEDAATMAKKFGLVLDTETSDAVEQFGFAQNELNLSLKGLGVQIGIAVMPALQKFITFLANDVVPPITDFVKKVMPGIVAGIEQFAGQIQAVFSSDMVSGLMSGIGTVIEQLTAGDFQGALETITNGLRTLVPAEVIDALGSLGTNAITGLTNFKAWLDENGPLITEQAIAMGLGIKEWFDTNGPTLVAGGELPFTKLREAIANVWTEITTGGAKSKDDFARISSEWNVVMQMHQKDFDKVKTKLADGWNEIQRAIGRAMNDEPVNDFTGVLGRFELKLPSTVQIFENFANQMVTLGNDIAAALSGIAAAIDAIVAGAQAARDFFDSIGGGTPPPPTLPTPSDTDRRREFGGGGGGFGGREFGGVQINLTYAPVVSLMDEAEAQTRLTPFVREAVRAAMGA